MHELDAMGRAAVGKVATVSARVVGIVVRHGNSTVEVPFGVDCGGVTKDSKFNPRNKAEGWGE